MHVQTFFNQNIVDNCYKMSTLIVLFLLSLSTMINNAANKRLLQQANECATVRCEYGYECYPNTGKCICSLFPDGPKCCNGNIECRGPCVQNCINFVFDNDCINERCSARCDAQCANADPSPPMCCDGKDYSSLCAANCAGAQNCVKRRCNCGFAGIGIGDMCCSIFQTDFTGMRCHYNGYIINSCVMCNGKEYENECIAGCDGKTANDCAPC
eukprot:225863_1